VDFSFAVNKIWEAPRGSIKDQAIDIQFELRETGQSGGTLFYTELVVGSAPCNAEIPYIRMDEFDFDLLEQFIQDHVDWVWDAITAQPDMDEHEKVGGLHKALSALFRWEYGADEPVRMARYYLRSPGPRPPFGQVVDHAFGPNAHVDTDGNSSTPNATDWTELYIALRPDHSPVVDICPTDASENSLRIEATSSHLAERVAEFLLAHCGGELQRENSQ
jgi:hypothetical protein